MNAMRVLLKAIVMAAVAAAVQPAAAARDAQSVQLLAQAQRPRADDAQRQPQRDFRRAERPPDGGARREGRLTDEERRDLRRDVDRANREIYKGR